MSYIDRQEHVVYGVFLCRGLQVGAQRTAYVLESTKEAIAQCETGVDRHDYTRAAATEVVGVPLKLKESVWDIFTIPDLASKGERIADRGYRIGSW